MRLIWFFLLLLLTACFRQTDTYVRKCGIHTALLKDTLCLAGPIDATMSEWVARTAGDYSRVEIFSNGGRIDEALTISEQLEREQVEVNITGPCLSACARYIVTAKTNVRIHQSAWIGLHRGRPGPFADDRCSTFETDEGKRECLLSIREANETLLKADAFLEQNAVAGRLVSAYETAVAASGRTIDEFINNGGLRENVFLLVEADLLEAPGIRIEHGYGESETLTFCDVKRSNLIMPRGGCDVGNAMVH